MAVAEMKRRSKDPYLPVAPELVGIDHQLDEIKRLLAVGPEAVKILGIYGMSGIGKTTIAKKIYNTLVDNFERHSFLEHLRAKQGKGLEELQQKLVGDLLGSGCRDLTCRDAGKDLRSMFRSKRVLILLDDIDDIVQLNALVSEEWFGEGSRIIFTTQHKNVIPSSSHPYEVREMEAGSALQLFYKHAFRDGAPTPELRELSDKIVQTTGRLPLALEIIGRSLYAYGGDVEKWKYTLNRLRDQPNKQVQDRLRISLDGVDYGTRQMFLDIACFFIGMDMRIAYYIWQACDFYPKHSIEELLQRSLIKIEDDNKIWMHVQLRDLGREMVRAENYDEPLERSRLWRRSEARMVLRGLEGRICSRPKAVSLQGNELGLSVDGKSFKKLPRLKFLRIQQADLTGDFRDCLQELLWLSYRNCPLKSKPKKLPLEKLLILDLSGSQVTKSWNGWTRIKISLHLKVLDLSGCHELEGTPDFSKFPNLERLILEGCSKLRKLHKSIVSLKGLAALNLRSCLELKKLPKKFGSSKSLIELILDGIQVKESSFLGGLENLEVLSAKGCCSLAKIELQTGPGASLCLLNLILDGSDIYELPDSIALLVKLQRLSANGTALEKLPKSIGGLKSLVELSISRTWVATLPESIRKLSNLEVLNASGCTRLKGGVPIEGLTRLKTLRLDDTGISYIPQTISGLSHLETLHLTGCQQLHALPRLPVSLISLRIPHGLEIPNLGSLINLDDLGYKSGARSTQRPPRRSAPTPFPCSILISKPCPPPLPRHPSPPTVGTNDLGVDMGELSISSFTELLGDLPAIPSNLKSIYYGGRQIFRN